MKEKNLHYVKKKTNNEQNKKGKKVFPSKTFYFPSLIM